ncbi:oligogalacturonide transporter [Paenibacillus sp. SORGH_AS306]|uniref:MFS transporter n=1 Tax=unclassified Paenibacillus TaxID=185978 RepID=UPI00278564DA|nr:MULTISPECIES: MFS transporter [unclassified Paenibacillus]MDQ1236341.1 oligogalacturonide transporter [Paenibacillus sp. SORGH_AS_0306]MDR6108695.1 oligogalacturonide transporter [Paenibacillus sp. SORGH_AS_0338]
MERTIKTRHTLAYGSGNILGSGALAVSGAWLLYFYTTFCGLSPVQAALIFSIASIVDAVSNPIMGFVSDNFHRTRLGRRFGRRKFFIMLGIPLMLVYPLMWMDGFGFWYYLSTYVLFELIYTSVMVPYEALASEMTRDFGARSRLTGWKAMFGKMANFAAAFIPGRFIAEYGKDSPLPFFYTGLVFAGLLIVALIFLYKNTWERPSEELQKELADEAPLSFIDSMKKLFIDISSTFRVKTFRHHLGMYLGGFSAEWLFTSAFTYFIVFSLFQSSEQVSNLNSFNSVIQLISTYFFIQFCVRKGFKMPFIMALTIVCFSVAGYGILYLTGASNMMVWLYVITLFMGLGTGGVYYIPWNQYTFLADVDEALTGRRREGIYAGMMTFAGKMVRAVVVFILGWVLQYFGFVSKALTQPVSAQHAIFGVLVFGTIILAIVGILATLVMKLTIDNHKKMIDEIDRLKAGGSMQDATPETRTIFEQLTGFAYERCWGHNNVGYKNVPRDQSIPVKT